ncbi:single-stranded DNA-binding protein, mitochondrial-like isoform X2 [Argiope bruennichi]|uniref:single-stranded DNA-binding protein, mitochondrial-like isoform X2 n=1 Tax=Argiope bruennichi TaxID=94029 RepID=UPI002494A9AF|nr:single-stranded DNA-binding protein, mitochondrial-like isoform X2 [Argiope bruennichi]
MGYPRVQNKRICMPLCSKTRQCSTTNMNSEDASRMHLEKSVNHVTLLGRVGIDPQLRGTETKPVVVFTLATNTNYKYETGEIKQKTDWHRITVFKNSLRDTVLEYLRKGSRVYVEGRIVYSEYNDNRGTTFSSTSIVANDVVFLGNPPRVELEADTEETS